MKNDHKEKALRNLGDAVINLALADHQYKIGTQDGPERDRKLVEAFATVVDQTCGLSGVYDYPQFMFDLCRELAKKVGCEVKAP